MSERIAFLGAGVMGGAMITAFGGGPTIVVAEPRAERADELRREHGVEIADNRAAVGDADIVVIAVKPQQVPDLLAEVGDLIRPGAVVVSLAAGVRIERFEASLADGVGVIRVMPNTPATVGQGVFGVSASARVAADSLARVTELLQAAGDVHVIDESLQDALTAVSGSGPAYAFYLAEQMIAGGIEAGLEPDVARALTVGTLKGAAALLESTGADPAELRRQVTSPNGTTAAAIAAFDDAGVAAALRSGVAAAARRSAELSDS